MLTTLPCVVIRPFLLTRAGIATARSARRKRGNDGSLRANENCSPSPTFTSCSQCHTSCPLCQRNPALLYNSLVPRDSRNAAGSRGRSQAPRRVDRIPGHLGYPGTESASLHPDIHCLVPVGGLSLESTHWIHPRYNFSLPVGVLNRLFRGKFIDALRRAYGRKNLSFGGATSLLKEPRAFAAFLRTSSGSTGSCTPIKPAGAAPVLRYLGRYTHRVAISNHRLLAFDGDRVTFRWKDYAHGNKQRLMTLSAPEFLRRYVQHILPHGFVRPAGAFLQVSLIESAPAPTPRVHRLFPPRRSRSRVATSGA